MSYCRECGKEVVAGGSLCKICYDKIYIKSPADLPEAGASAERISSVVRCCQNSEDILKETIENALYSTGNFTIEQCTDLAEGLILFIRDSFKNKSAIAHNEYGLTAVRQH